jgi:ribosome-associated protein
LVSENQTREDLKNLDAENLKLTVLNAQLCQDKLAEDVFVLDLRGVDSAPADFFVVASCDSMPQVQAIADSIMRTIRNYGLARPKVEGADEGEWALLDYFDVIVHVMLKNIRDFYKLEKLWGDAVFSTVDDEGNLHQIDYDEVIRIYN